MPTKALRAQVREVVLPVAIELGAIASIVAQAIAFWPDARRWRVTGPLPCSCSVGPATSAERAVDWNKYAKFREEPPKKKLSTFPAPVADRAAMKTLFAILSLLALVACASSENEGCMKDSDCASGRICRDDGRCSSPDSSNRDGVSAPAGTASVAAPSPGGTLVDRCSEDLRCVVDGDMYETSEDATAMVRRVDGKCIFSITFADATTDKAELEPNGKYRHEEWKSDAAHLVVTIGGGNIIFDCGPR
jgi:hypothetical protein